MINLLLQYLILQQQTRHFPVSTQCESKTANQNTPVKPNQNESFCATRCIGKPDYSVFANS